MGLARGVWDVAFWLQHAAAVCASDGDFGDSGCFLDDLRHLHRRLLERAAVILAAISGALTAYLYVAMWGVKLLRL